MFIDNHESLDLNNMFIYNDKELVDYLTIDKKIPYVSSYFDFANNEPIWYFVKNEKLNKAILDYVNG